jgi:hypothetical protein
MDKANLGFKGILLGWRNQRIWHLQIQKVAICPKIAVTQLNLRGN